MASIPVVLQRIRRARREADVPQTDRRFETYEPEYRRILAAVEEAGGERSLEAVMEWAIEWTQREKRLPEPETLRAGARSSLDERDIEIPAALEPRE